MPGCFSIIYWKGYPPSELLFHLCQKSVEHACVGFPGGSAGKDSARNEGDLDSIPGLGRSPGEGKGHPLQYSGLENSMNRLVHGVANSQTQVSGFHFLWVSYSIPLFCVCVCVCVCVGVCRCGCGLPVRHGLDFCSCTVIIEILKSSGLVSPLLSTISKLF